MVPDPVPPEAICLEKAGLRDMDLLALLVGEFHELEGVNQSAESRRGVLAQLLDPALTIGEAWLIRRAGTALGYVVLSHGFSIEFEGRDVLIDEIYLQAPFRGQGIGALVLDKIMDWAGEQGLRAVHLEVAESNRSAIGLYGSRGFEYRRGYHLMSRRLGRDGN
ncbi:MAG: GNAT family N-acetyltransferase [Xanthomonadales bacterium]|nr:GNAT family N-acetyltransferase [Xanthomonadales bacterium]